MSASPWSVLLGYSLGVVGASLVGGMVALLGRGHSRRLELFLAASAGVMLGVVGGHLLPEAFEATPHVAWALVAGFLFMLLVERFVLPHALHAPHAAEEHAECGPEVERQHVRADIAGLGTFLGLSLHTLVDGLALGAALAEPLAAPFVFLGIVSHKVPSAFALGSILVRGGARGTTVGLATAALGAMVGVGATLFLLLRQVGELDAGRLAPFAVAFSAGSFLHVIATDLLPDLHRQGTRRRALVAALLGGLVLTVGLSLVVPE